MTLPMRESKKIPYYEHSQGVTGQIRNSGGHRKTGTLLHVLRSLRNHVCQILAYDCPINSWRVKLHRWRGVNIGKNVFLGQHCTLDNTYPEYIYLEDGCGLSGEAYILAHQNPGVLAKSLLEAYVAPVVIQKNVFVGIRCTILPGVTIGEKAIVSAGSIISKDVPPHSVVAPAKNRIIKNIE